MEGIVAGPVGAVLRGSLGRSDAWKETRRNESSAGLQKISLIHSARRSGDCKYITVGKDNQFVAPGATPISILNYFRPR
jgi:hypothetical protein